MHQIIHIHAEAPPKPALGAACNGCGQCCLAEPCPVGMVISRKRHGACRALQWSDASQRYRCGMLSQALNYLGWRGTGRASNILNTWLARLCQRWIAAGIGCDADIESGH